MNQFQELTTLNHQKAADEQSRQRHEDQIMSQIDIQETILQAFKTFAEFMDNRTSKTAVVNQLREIGTPDALVVADEVVRLKELLAGEDYGKSIMSEMTEVMRQVLDEAKQIPKTLPEQEKQIFIDYTDRLIALESRFDELLQAVKDQTTTVEAPIVNVPETQVSVEAPDLSPLEKEMKKLDKPQADIDHGAMMTKDVANLIGKYTRFRIEYLDTEGFDEDEEDNEPLVDKIHYYNGNKKVATLEFRYRGKNLVGMRKT